MNVYARIGILAADVMRARRIVEVADTVWLDLATTTYREWPVDIEPCCSIHDRSCMPDSEGQEDIWTLILPLDNDKAAHAPIAICIMYSGCSGVRPDSNVDFPLLVPS